MTASAGEARSKADPALLAAIGRGEPVSFMVVLAERADLSAAESLPTRLEKTRYVYQMLRATARRTQPALRAELERQGFRVTSFTIANELLAEPAPGKHATVDGLLALAARGDVARVEPVGKVLLPDPIGPDERTPAAKAAALAAAPNWNPSVVAIGARQLIRAGIDGRGVVVGIADSGVQASHPALAHNYRGRHQGHDYNWFDPTSEQSPVPVDTNGHGTHVTGIAVGDTPTRHIGVAPGAQWIHCRALGPGSSRATVLACLDWFLAPTDVAGRNPDPDRSPDVVNNSYICPFCELEPAFQSFQAAGIFAVGATGNFGPTCGSVFSPGDYTEVTAVGATDGGRNSALASYSSRGPVDGGPLKPELVVPGTDILSAVPLDDYELLTGTSMAAPHLTGAVALLWSARPELRGHIVATRKVLYESAAVRRDRERECPSPRRVPNSLYGYGFLDIHEAVCGAGGCP